MKTPLLGCIALLVALPAANAADVEADRAKVTAVCGACHGVTGVSVSEAIPNLAAQRAGYIEAQLKALKEGTRKAPIMNAIATQLSADEIANVAAYFAALPGAPTGSTWPTSCSSTPRWLATPAGARTSPTCCATKTGIT